MKLRITIKLTAFVPYATLKRSGDHPSTSPNVVPTFDRLLGENPTDWPSGPRFQMTQQHR